MKRLMKTEHRYFIAWVNCLNEVIHTKEVSKASYYRYLKKKNAKAITCPGYFSCLHICNMYE